MAKTINYPLGIQTFSEIIEGGMLYIDKTEYVYNMTNITSLLYQSGYITIKDLKTFLATIPRSDNTGYEGHWQ